MARLNSPPAQQLMGLRQPKFAFEDVPNRTRSAAMAWHGRLSVVLDDMLEPVRGGYGDRWLKRNFWQPSRVMRAVIDSGIDGADRVQLVNRVAAFGVKAYAGNLIHQDVLQLTEDIRDTGLHRENITQPLDETTRKASESRLSRNTAGRLAKGLQRPPFFIGVCHGGFVSTVQTGLYFENAQQADSQLYAVRYSMDKAEDMVPRINDEEYELFERASADRTLVVADEDAFSGESMAGVVGSLKANIPGAEVIGVVNYDQRMYEDRLDQGVWWEYC